MKLSRMLLITGLLSGFTAIACAQQTVRIEGWVYEDNGRGYIHGADVYLFTSHMAQVAETQTDDEGHFVFDADASKTYIVRAVHKFFETKEVPVDPAHANEHGKIFLKMPVERKPGYIFDVTLAEPRPAPGAPTNSVSGATIEIYNNTRDTMEYVSENHPSPYFKFPFEQGNHYTVMISKKGYITKQIEAYVNVHGCIICIDGVDNVKPGVVDNLTAGHQRGTLLANIELHPVKIGQKIPVGPLYYESGKYKVTDNMHKALQEVINLMKNNPSLILELRSHTDCRGDADFNKKLSIKRARAAVKYILEHSDIPEYRLKAVGMGESQPVKKCKDCRHCSKRILAMNRRTELVITGILHKTPVKLPLTRLKEEERMEKLTREVMFGEQIVVPAGGELPEELKKQLEAEQQTAGAPETDNRTPDAPPANHQPALESKVPEKAPPVTGVDKKTGKESSAKPHVPEGDVNSSISPPNRDANRPSGNAPSVDSLEAARRRAEKVFADKQLPDAPDPEVQHFQRDLPEPPKEGPKDTRATHAVESVNLAEVDLEHEVPAIEPDYTGYSIEVKRTSYALPPGSKLFNRFSELYYYKRPNGDYCYLTGKFATRKVADLALEYVRKQWGSARLVLFRNGKPVD